MSEGCTILGVGPWQIKSYAEVIVDICADIRYDGHQFETIVEHLDHSAAGAVNTRKLDEFRPQRER